MCDYDLEFIINLSLVAFYRCTFFHVGKTCSKLIFTKNSGKEIYLLIYLN